MSGLGSRRGKSEGAGVADHSIAANARPWPRADETTMAYWEAAAEHQVMVRRCGSCGEFHHPTVVQLECCHNPSPSWFVTAGTGVVYSYAIDHRNLIAGFDQSYVVATVVLDDVGGSVRLVCNLVDIDHEDVRIGMPVRATFEMIGHGVVIPQFAPLHSEDAG